MKFNPLDDDRPGLTRRQLIGLATLTGDEWQFYLWPRIQHRSDHWLGHELYPRERRSMTV